MKNIELSACEEMIMTIIWNNEAELDLAAVMTQTNERYHTAWKPQTEEILMIFPDFLESI